MNRISNTPNKILVEYSDNPTLRITAGVIFSIVMGIYAVLSLFMIFGGLFLSSVESDISDATGGAVESSGVGLLLILIVFVMLAIYLALIHI